MTAAWPPPSAPDRSCRQPGFERPRRRLSSHKTTAIMITTFSDGCLIFHQSGMYVLTATAAPPTTQCQRQD